MTAFTALQQWDITSVVHSNFKLASVLAATLAIFTPQQVSCQPDLSFALSQITTSVTELSTKIHGRSPVAKLLAGHIRNVPARGSSPNVYKSSFNTLRRTIALSGKVLNVLWVGARTLLVIMAPLYQTHDGEITLTRGSASYLLVGAYPQLLYVASAITTIISS